MQDKSSDREALTCFTNTIQHENAFPECNS